MRLPTIAAAAFLALVSTAPAYAGTDWTDRKALLAAGCTVRDHPNPTNKIVARPPVVSCSPEAKLALAEANRAKTASQAGQTVAGGTADTAHHE